MNLFLRIMVFILAWHYLPVAPNLPVAPMDLKRRKEIIIVQNYFERAVHAIVQDDVEALKKEMAYILDLGMTDQRGRSLLRIAAESNSVKTLKFLMQNGLTPPVFRGGYRPLFWASLAKGATKAAHVLNLPSFGDTKLFQEKRDPGIIHAVQWACDVADDLRSDELDITQATQTVERLLDSKKFSITSKNVEGLTPLLKAVDHQNFQYQFWLTLQRRLCLINSLIARGGYVAMDAYQKKLFHDYLYNRKIILQLHYSGASSVREREMQVINQVERAVNFYESKIRDESLRVLALHIPLITDKKSEISSVMKGYIAQESDSDLLKNSLREDVRLEILLHNRIPKEFLECADEMGYTPLLYAVYMGRAHEVQQLLDAGARIDAVTRDDNNAWDLAQRMFDSTQDNRYTTIIKLLNDYKLAVVKQKK